MSFRIDFLGIGTEKAATYWVANCLKDHPEICFSDKKELAFFGEFDQHFLKFRNPRYSWGINWYQKQFNVCPKNKLKGEFTPTYLYSFKAAERIKKDFPDVKLIVTFRDPVERAFSQYLHDLSTGVIRNITFEQALKKHTSYIEKGFYYKYLTFYLKLFSRKQIFIIFTDDIKKNPQKVIKKLYTFLNLKNTNFIPQSLYTHPNQASHAKFPLLNFLFFQVEYFLRKNKLDFIFKFLTDSGIRKKIFIFSYYTNRKPITVYPVMKEGTKVKLRKIFFRDTQKFEKLVKRDLSSWKTI